ncbi:mu-type opioid receptor-like [Mercenaria mercenaria]|uniref:mu-type opioid receptor-like n=1 Tax=Mercenaria mercenaria TaxID=6596 RepID=UPI00234E38C9|nr:mu-type opioid receptor-like [Mercenaria mercenaria]XP_053401844.1 mu-type opioid receptor-like [Mercenaria mercenaria]XP_053401845.1 mu-type opioid receptor-like [Mercenaria mercenaria]
MDHCNSTIVDNISSSSSQRNGSESISDEAELEKLITYYTMEIGVPIVCAFGMIGNLLNFMVLTREKISRSLTKMEKSAHIGLIGLAISDFMFCLLAFIYTRIEYHSEYAELSGVLYFHWLGGPLITWFIVTSTWLTVAMAGERYLAVCHPFKARKLISLKKTRIIIAVVYFVCLGLTIPIGFEKIIKDHLDCVGQTYYKIEPRPEFTDSVVVIRRLVWAILFDFIPCIALLYFNVCLIYKIHNAKTLRKAMAPAQKNEVLLTKYPRELFSYNSNSMSSNVSGKDRHAHSFMHYSPSHQKNQHSAHGPHRSYSNKSWRYSPRQSLTMNATPQKKQMRARRRQTDNALNSVTATLVAVVVLFLILVSPSEILKFIYQIGGGSNTNTYKIIQSITNLMQAINFSVNFVLYCAVNKSFRSSLAVIFCFFCRRGRHTFKLRSLERAYCHKMEFSESES